jgi:hypothetical protein
LNSQKRKIKCHNDGRVGATRYHAPTKQNETKVDINSYLQTKIAQGGLKGQLKYQQQYSGAK